MRKSESQGREVALPTLRFGPILNIALVALAAALVIGGAAACGDSGAVDGIGGVTEPSDPGIEVPANGAGDAGGQGQGASSSAATGDDADDSVRHSGAGGSDGTVSYANPNGQGVNFQDTRSPALENAASIDAVTWTTEPSIRDGALEAAGALTPNARLSEPMNGEGSAFSVYYDGHDEALVELLPDLGPMQIWDTNATVAPTEFELASGAFTIRAYSPLFMDVGTPSELELRVWGYDQAGQEVLLSVRRVNAE